MRNKQSRIFLLVVFSLLLSGITTVSYSYDVIRSKKMMEDAAKKAPASTTSTTTITTETKQNTGKKAALPAACTCSPGVLIDADNPMSGYIYHCQCGKLECAVTQGNKAHSAMSRMARPPLFCK